MGALVTGALWRTQAVKRVQDAAVSFHLALRYVQRCPLEAPVGPPLVCSRDKAPNVHSPSNLPTSVL